jgi:plasmid stabilization system protein ParE
VAVRVVAAPEAEQDVADAYAWYEGQRAGLGEEFLGCLDACVEAVRRSPKANATIFRRFRRALLRRFPYAVFYEYDSGVVIVFGVFHTSRHPMRWIERATRNSE